MAQNLRSLPCDELLLDVLRDELTVVHENLAAHTTPDFTGTWHSDADDWQSRMTADELVEDYHQRLSDNMPDVPSVRLRGDVGAASSSFSDAASGSSSRCSAAEGFGSSSTTEVFDLSLIHI